MKAVKGAVDIMISNDTVHRYNSQQCSTGTHQQHGRHSRHSRRAGSSFCASFEMPSSPWLSVRAAPPVASSLALSSSCSLRIYVYEHLLANQSMSVQSLGPLYSNGQPGNCLLTACNYSDFSHANQRVYTSEIPLYHALMSTCPRVTRAEDADLFVVPLFLGLTTTAFWGRNASAISRRVLELNQQTFGARQTLYASLPHLTTRARACRHIFFWTVDADWVRAWARAHACVTCMRTCMDPCVGACICATPVSYQRTCICVSCRSCPQYGTLRLLRYRHLCRMLSLCTSATTTGVAGLGWSRTASSGAKHPPP